MNEKQTKGRNLHAQAAQAREKGKFIQSLTLNDHALFAYDADNDMLGFTEGIACRSITLRVYANSKNSRRILTLAKFEMMASVAIAKESKNPEALALPLYNLAQVQEDLGELKVAVATYQEALSTVQNNPHLRNRPAFLATMQVHMTMCGI